MSVTVSNGDYIHFDMMRLSSASMKLSDHTVASRENHGIVS